MENNLKTLLEAYKEVIKIFETKHNLEFTHFQQSDWTSYAYFGIHYFFSMQDILKDIASQNAPNEITKWFDNRDKHWVETTSFDHYQKIIQYKEENK